MLFRSAGTTYFARKMQVLPDGPAKMSRWRKGLFMFLHSNSADVGAAFGLPPAQTVEFGFQMQL